MTFGKIKRRKADILFSQYLRKLRDYTCEMCLRKFPEGKGLEASHFWSRRYENGRFDIRNVDALCTGCHRKAGEEPGFYTEWKRKRLGESEYKKLDFEVHQIGKKDDKKVIVWVTEKLKKL